MYVGENNKILKYVGVSTNNTEQVSANLIFS